MLDYPSYHNIPYQTNLPHFASIRKNPLLRVWIRDIADKLYISLTIFTETCRNAGKVEYLSDPPPNSFKSCMILSTNTWGEVQPHRGSFSARKTTFPVFLSVFGPCFRFGLVQTLSNEMFQRYYVRMVHKLTVQLKKIIQIEL